MDQVQKDFKDIQNITAFDASKIQTLRDIGISVGRSEIVTEIKDAYILTGIPLVEKILKHTQSGENEDLRKCFHKMKSGCANVGFIRLQKMCEFGEELLKKSPPTSPENLQYISAMVDEEFKKSLTILESV
jgi:HPt (histidine-containing phosphotransfer) domain-containing protein